MSREQARAIADQYAQDVLRAVGGEYPHEYTGTEEAPCEGRMGELSEEIFSIYHGYQIRDVPPERQVVLAERVRDHLIRRGYRIKDFRTWPERDSAVVTARNEADGYEVSFESTSPPTAISLSVTSPCFRMRDAQP
ncbi:hypothetical protein [Carbonactinospora thermoautotrophica]|nr:hypothetical protein [Carbonactinospora thermoautotrophica]